MTKEILLENLAQISIAVGKHPAYVQGGGGNTSVKIDNTMAIKASGGLLKNVTKEDGYSVVDYKKIAQYLDTPDNSDDVFAQKIKSFVLATQNRPSIETGFHAVLKTFVIHTHSVFCNILTCSDEGKNIAKKLFSNSIWIEYETPGKDITLAIKNAIKENGTIPECIFLENHGIITTAETSTECLDIHTRINATLMKHFCVDMSDFNAIKDFYPLDYIRENIIFPDQVVFTMAGAEMLETAAAKETLQAYTFIFKTIQDKGLTLRTLSPKNADILLNMESEKFRQSITK